MNVPATDCEQIFGFSLFCHDSAKSMQASLALAVPESRLHTFIAAHHQHKASQSRKLPQPSRMPEDVHCHIAQNGHHFILGLPPA